ncbi:MAG TPA: hypothetical protein VN894_06145, partial [Polyangiaceae bacterium]|nr:hypothetical protein [Polyangiaceae bacterium]
KQGYVLDEKSVWPPSLIDDLRSAGFSLPKATAGAYPPGTVTLDGGADADPTVIPPSKKLADGATTDPTDDAAC